VLVRLRSGNLMTVRRQAGLPAIKIGENVSLRWDKDQARFLEGRPVAAAIT
jgi:putative spermidine/putrescine transport system ATP-binding protein